MPPIPQFAEIITAAALAATGGWFYVSLAPWSTLFGKALRDAPNPENGRPQIALTFDDGPNPDWTPQLLDVLARQEIRATFFLIGQYAAAQPELVRRTHAAGHLIGNHTWSHPNLAHPNLAHTSAKQTREELSRTSQQIEQITGEQVRYFRPPFGSRRPATFRIARQLGLIPVTWNAIGNDWTKLSADGITDHLTKLIHRNDRRGNTTNAVLHDGSHRSPNMDRSRSVQAADQLIQRFKPTHKFVTLDEWSQDKRS
jgi:peptidoglycan/xylan/chitin deacetylase (PgdA/CDA1 family)